MTNKEAVNWIINLSADIGKSKHSELWHYEKALCEIRELLESAEEPKKGHWIGIAYDGYADGYPVYDEWECSCCGVIEEDDEPTWNYCPNCGARMDLDEVEE